MGHGVSFLVRCGTMWLIICVSLYPLQTGSEWIRVMDFNPLANQLQTPWPIVFFSLGCWMQDSVMEQNAVTSANEMNCMRISLISLLIFQQPTFPMVKFVSVTMAKSISCFLLNHHQFHSLTSHFPCLISFSMHFYPHASIS